jgi:hypothetical protein
VLPIVWGIKSFERSCPVPSNWAAARLCARRMAAIIQPEGIDESARSDHRHRSQTDADSQRLEA